MMICCSSPSPRARSASVRAACSWVPMNSIWLAPFGGSASSGHGKPITLATCRHMASAAPASVARPSSSPEARRNMGLFMESISTKRCTPPAPAMARRRAPPPQRANVPLASSAVATACAWTSPPPPPPSPTSTAAKGKPPAADCTAALGALLTDAPPAPPSWTLSAGCSQVASGSSSARWASALAAISAVAGSRLLSRATSGAIPSASATSARFSPTRHTSASAAAACCCAVDDPIRSMRTRGTMPPTWATVLGTTSGCERASRAIITAASS